ncbi:aggregation factor core [Tateyamaria omphalii]|uniref:aggregation factor core n=1 Tax=Tateyamaria omphalii TaxID=299262 RepID=UPI001C99B88C|nr:aggregation factor core [Tateyamaria omphalii]MBY5933134.1 aggregation factor core [Tateyamaria omphalii]
MRAILLALSVLIPSAAVADLTVSFRDGAPKDRFTLSYDGACALDRLDVQIDLGAAPAGLIFDTTAAGAGVEVFQPLEWVSGAASTSEVTDGDTLLSLSLDEVRPGATWAFTVDIDDTTSTRQITVDGSEMAGAVLRADGQAAAFDASGMATVRLANCLS